MKVSNKMKIISMAAITIAAIVTIACANVSNPTDEPSSTQQWQKKYPQIFSNVGYSKLIESQGKLSQYQNKSESTQELIGTITNQFGIRDDILNFTLNYFQSNESATYAAIRFLQNDMNVFMATNVDTAVLYQNKNTLYIHCLMNIIDVYTANKYVNKIEYLKTNTPARMLQENKIKTYLNLKILGNTITTQNMDKICEQGNY
ncbi:MAG: hypothetical protein K2Y14_07330 [Burkholderiales bacterium]|nr:hypothetical protein [Burkholderiales bacterium]